MSHPTHVMSLSPLAKRYVSILFKELIPLTCLKAWQEITGSRMSGRPFGASVTGSRAGYINGAPRTSVT